MFQSGFGSSRLSDMFPVPSQDVGPETGQQEHVGHEDDGVRPSGAVEAVVGNRVEHRRGEELQRVGGMSSRGQM